MNMQTRYLAARRTQAPARGQRGLATLVIVAILFFVLSMVAAYTNRNLIFEQRTATNQLRSTQALEAAEAGVEWALAMLNAGRVDAGACAPTADLASDTFRQRYLTADTGTGLVTVRPVMGSGALARAWPTCVQNGTDWTCVCPATTSATPAAPTGDGVAPAFRMRFVQVAGTARSGTVWLQVNGCTRMESTCLDFPAVGGVASVSAGEGRVRIEVLVALKPVLSSLPLAAVTVRGDLLVNGNLTAANPTRSGSGIAVLAGGSIGDDANLSLSGPAGTPLDIATLRLASDSALATLTMPAPSPVTSGDRFFSAVHGAWPLDHRDQPATLRIDCSAVCDADRLRTLAARNPGRVLWADGDVSLSGTASLGTATAPVALVVTGDLSIDDITVFGYVHGSANTWTLTGNGGTVRGALLASNDLTIPVGAAVSVLRDAEVLDVLRTQHGSFVRVPGGWRDF